MGRDSGFSMTRETEQWLGPMITALLTNKAGAAAFARFMEAAITTRGASTPAVDWIRIGRLIRDELGWDRYPVSPPR